MATREEKLNEKYSFGQKMIKKMGLNLKPIVAYIVCDDAGYEYLIKMSYSLPYKPGDKHFFVHIDDLTRKWHHAKEGIQTKLFK
jgi:hypothetical protein